MPIELASGDTVFERYRVEWPPIAYRGQGILFRGTDLLAPMDEPWRSRVFIKQFHDLPVRSKEARAAQSHYQSLKERLGSKSGYICLPEHIAIAPEFDSVVAVFPWIAGHNLLDALDRDLRQSDRTRICVAICKSLAMIHENGVAHLDLSPTNMMVTESRKGQIYIKLVDLDASKIDGKGLRPRALGQEMFTSPEFDFPGRYGSTGPASDVFVMGIILYSILLGEHPFAAALDYSQAVANEEFVIPPCRYHRRIMWLIERCLSANPGQRPTAATVYAELDDLKDSNFEAVEDLECWSGEHWCVRLSTAQPTRPFRRTYYKSVVLDAAELRGLSSPLPSGKILTLEFDDRGCVLRPHEDLAIMLDEQVLKKGKRARLFGRQRLVIGSTCQLLIEIEGV